MVQRNRLTRFRQALYDQVFVKRRDAQQELLDALLLSPPIRSFPELSLTPGLRRQWHSLYAAVEDGRQDNEALTGHLIEHLPEQSVLIFALDESAWPRPEAHTLEDRAFVHSATPTIDGAGIVIGHSYSTLAYVTEPESSWTLPVSIERVATGSDAVEVGLEQIEHLLQERAEEPGLCLVCGDTRYGNHRFLGGLSQQTQAGCLGRLVRLRCDRVLYGEPGPYSGRGRPRVHGPAFRFKDEATWPEPAQQCQFEHARYGQVELRLWQGLHAKEDAQTRFSVLLARIHLERSKPPKPLWLAWRGPALPVEELWGYYQQRGTLEASFRFRKQYLYWTLPRFQTIASCLRWTNLVTLAQWTLYLCREVVQDQPLPWQPKQARLTPERVKQSLGGLFAEIGTPAQPPKRRGKSPGWPKGKVRGPRRRYAVVRKGAAKGQAA